MSRRAMAWLIVATWALTSPALAQSTPRDEAPAADGGETSASGSAPSWQLKLAAGGGIGMRALDLPRAGVVYQTRTGVFPAIDLGFALDHGLSAAFRVGLHARYQTSVGLRITELHTGGRERTQGLRSHRLELALAPSLRLDAAGSWRATALIGYGMCDLRPEVHLETPGYVLGGPFVRVELQIPLGTPRVRVRIAPEVQGIVQVGKELEHEGFASSGFALGGAAALEVVLTERWSVAASLSELHAWLGSAQPESLSDSSRFVTARLTGAL